MISTLKSVCLYKNRLKADIIHCAGKDAMGEELGGWGATALAVSLQLTRTNHWTIRVSMVIHDLLR